ncbi:MAG: hypothetical protein ABIH23_05040 [bacterium]
MNENNTPKQPEETNGDAAPKQPDQSPSTGPRPRRVISVKELAARERALSDVAEQQKAKNREEQQANWREELNRQNFVTMAGVFVDMHRGLERSRIKGDLTEQNQRQALAISHWVAEFHEHLRLLDNIRANIEKLIASLGLKSIDEVIEMLQKVRPEGVAAVEQTREKQNLLVSELQRIGSQILDEKRQLDEEIQSNLSEDQALQDEIRKVARRMVRKAGIETLNEVHAATRLPLEERLLRLRAIHENLQRSLRGQIS